jgi:hypothetical protein
VAFRYEPGRRLQTLVYKVWDLCTAEISDVVEPDGE